MSYEEIRAGLCQAYGWSFADVDNLSFEQLDSAAREGKKSKGIPINAPGDALTIAREWRKYYGI